MNFYFQDFASDLVDFEIIRNLEVVGTTRGLFNRESGSDVWQLYPDAKIQTGDILRDTKRSKTYQINNFELDSFAGSDFYQVFFTVIS